MWSERSGGEGASNLKVFGDGLLNNRQSFLVCIAFRLAIRQSWHPCRHSFMGLFGDHVEIPLVSFYAWSSVKADNWRVDLSFFPQPSRAKTTQKIG